MEKYIGKKIEGFKFSEDEACGYVPDMDLLIGVEGEITHYKSKNDSFEVYFGGSVFWSYPARLVLERLEAYVPLDNFTQLWDDNISFTDDDRWDKSLEFDVNDDVIEIQANHHSGGDNMHIVLNESQVKLLMHFLQQEFLNKLERKERIIQIMHDDEESGLYND